jgi:calcineurin-like phosphoesterase family protein
VAIFFTADTHFDHDLIIDACKRPFSNRDHMNYEIIKRWNSVVTNNDLVYFLGDFKLTSKHSQKELIKQLNGEIVFVRGNHDSNNGTKTIADKIISSYFGKKLILVHDPKEANGVKYDIALVGHVHEKWKFDKKKINVGVDVWDFYPIHMQQILKAWKRFKESNNDD